MGGTLRLAIAVYAGLLYLCSAELRRTYGEEMTRLFRERCARASAARGILGMLPCALGGWADLIWIAVLDRLEPRTSGPGSPHVRATTLLAVLLQEFRLAVRSFLRQPLFTGTVVVTIGVGIGAATAIFGLVNAAVLRPLPYPDAAGILSVVRSDARFGLIPFGTPYLSDLRDRLEQFEVLAGFTASWSLTLTGSGEPRMVEAAYVSDGLLALLGAEVSEGRDMSDAEHASATSRVVVVSRSFWEREFGHGTPFDERIIRLNHAPHVIIGILRDELRMPLVASVVDSRARSAEIWLPLSTNELAPVRSIPIVNMVGRLRPGVTLAQAQLKAEAALAELSREHRDLEDGNGVMVLPLRDHVSRDVRNPLLLLLGAVGGLLLIACANVGNLMLARSAGRTGELAVRISLGATRARLAGQMLIESLTLGLAGGALGLFFAWWSLRAFPAFGFERLPPSASPRVDGLAALFAAGCALGTTLLIGIIPTIRAWQRAPHALLKEGGRNASSRSHRARQALVFAEVSVALVLLTGAGLLARSFWTLTRVESGISADRVLAAGISLPASRYPGGEVRLAFASAALAQLEALPGVERTALVNRLPFGGANTLVGIEIEGRGDSSTGTLTVDRRVVSTDYFETMGIPVLAGRAFGGEDRTGAAEAVAIVNATAALRFWPAGAAPGQRLRLLLRGGPGPWLRVVGVAGDVRHHGLDQPPQPEIYVPYTQAPVESFVLLVRAADGSDPLSLAAPLRRTIRRLDAELPLQRTGVASAGISRSIAEPRVRAMIFGAFGVAALLLAAIGIYGVISCAVASRTRDIGLRIAFGARPADIFRLVLREGMGLVAAGVCVGILGSLLLTRLLTAQLFGVTPTDPVTFMVVTTMLILVAFLAHLIPARRAMRLDPVDALRKE